MKQHSTSSPKSSTDLTQPSGEEGTMPYDSDDSSHLHSLLPPSLTVSDDSENPDTKIDRNLNDPPCQGNEDVAQKTTLLKDTADFIKNSEGIVGEEVGPSESESWDAQDAEAFELSEKTGEEGNKNVDDLNELGGEEMKGLKDNSVAVPQEIAMKAALTHTIKQKHSTSSPKSSIGVTQPTGEEGKMLSDSDDSPHLRSLHPPLSTVSDISVSMEDALPVDQPLETSIQENGDAAMPRTRIDPNLKKPLCVGDDDFVGEHLLKEIAYWRALNDFLTNSIEGHVDLGQLECLIKEFKEIVGEEVFELSGKTGEEDNKNVDELNDLGGEEMKGLKVGEEHKNVDDLKDNLVAVPQEIAMEAALTTHSEQPLQNSIQGNDEAANPRTRIDPSLNEPPCQEDEDMAHQITLLKAIADYPSMKRLFPFSDCSASDDFIKNSVDDNVDPEKLEDKTNPPESESLEAQDAEAEAFELSGKTGDEHSKNVDNLNELGGEEMTGLKDNSEAVPQEIASEAALAHSYEEAKKELAVILDSHLNRLELIFERTRAILEAIKKSSQL